MNLSLFIAKRTALTSQRTDGSRASRSPAVGVAVTAVALSVVVMLCAVAVVAGFKQQITDKISGFNSHLQIYRVSENNTDNTDTNIISLTPTLRSILNSQPYITTYGLELTVPAVLKTNSDFKGVYVKGVDNSQLTDFLSSQIVVGEMPDYSSATNNDDIAISQKIADELHLQVGDSILTYFLHNDIQARRYNIASIYATHFDTFDDLIVVGDIAEMRGITNLKPEQGVTLRLYTNNMANADAYALQLQQTLDKAYINNELFVRYQVESTTTRNAAYFSWLQLLDTNVVVILSLMTVVACITLIAAMLILIIDKVRLIGILRAMGATRNAVNRIFIFMALRIAFYGLIIGNAIALLLILLQKKWQLLPLDADSYYIDYVPVQIEWSTVLLLNAAVAIVVLISLLLPSVLAGKISPAQAMRYQD